MDFKGKRVVVMGLGSYERGSGISAALFLARAGARVLVTDLKPRASLGHQIQKLKKYRNVRFMFGKHREADFKNADLIIKNPDVPKSSPYLKIAVKYGIPIHNDWTIFLLLHENPLIGVTGTRGKTTTATLLNEFLKEDYKTLLVGNMGTSPLAVVQRIKPRDVLVAELSSWNLQQFPTIKKSPHIAVITNLLADHLNKYRSIKEYWEDKEYIWKYQTPEDFLVANRDNAALRKRIRSARSRPVRSREGSQRASASNGARVFWFSKKPFRGDGVQVKNGRIYFAHRGKVTPVCRISDIRLEGGHNLENVLAAVCAAMIAGVPPAHIRKVLKKFIGVANRLELLGEKKGVRYCNDTTATTPDATIAALRALDSRRVILLAGGTDKRLDFTAFAGEVRKYRPRLVLFRGTATDKMLKELKNYPHALGVAGSMREAVRLARAQAKKGDVILLSPGAASFGMFKNEFDRGEQFRKLVKDTKML